MPKLHAIAALEKFTMDTVEYVRDEVDGFFHIAHPAHVEAALMHGMVIVPEDVAHPDQLVLPVDNTARDAELSAKDAEIAELKAKLAEMGSASHADAEDHSDSQGTDAPAQDADASGDTSEGKEGTGEGQEEAATAVPTPEQIAAMTRDEAVAFMTDKGVALPGNVSTADAQAAVTSWAANASAA